MTNFDDRFFSIWNGIPGLEIPESNDDETICVYALGFLNWTENLMKSFEKPDIIRINQAKILLMDKFFDWQRFVPQSHRQRLGVHGHTCIFQILEKAYERLRIMELSLTPPIYFLPENPIKPPNFLGLVLGEDTDIDNE